jgi:hypothetical protein
VFVDHFLAFPVLVCNFVHPCHYIGDPTDLSCILSHFPGDKPTLIDQPVAVYSLSVSSGETSGAHASAGLTMHGEPCFVLIPHPKLRYPLPAVYFLSLPHGSIPSLVSEAPWSFCSFVFEISCVVRRSRHDAHICGFSESLSESHALRP